MNKRSLIESLALHSLLVLGLLVPYCSSGGGNNAGEDGDGSSAGEANVDIIPKKSDASDAEPEPPTPMTVELIEIPKPETEGKEECLNGQFYGGIGVVRDPFTNTITEVPPGYPAFKAGMLPGDIIVSNEEIRGEPDTSVIVKVLRAGLPLTFELVRDKICTEQVVDKP